MTGRSPRIPGPLLVLLRYIGNEAIVGDLEEEYLERALPRRGPIRARIWFWKHVLKTVTVGIAKTAVFNRSIAANQFGVHPTRGTPRGEVMSTFAKDVRFGIRMLFRTPGLSLVAVTTIALGVGLTTHTFSTVYGTVMRGLPFEGGDRMMHVSGTLIKDGLTGRSVPIHDYRDWREQQTAFVDLAAFYNNTINLADDHASPEQYLGTVVSASMFSEVGGRPLIGRVTLEADERGQGARVLVLSHNVWQTRYGGDPDIVGKQVRANGVANTVVGVMPEGFRFPFDSDMWMPMDQNPDQLARGDGIRVDVVGRLMESVSLEEARTQMAGIAQRLAIEYPETNEGVGVFIHPYIDEIMPPQITAVMYIMLTAVFGVLLIACANVANLLVARSVIRSKEVAIRSALGASRSRVIRQLLVEAAILATVGGFVGIVLSWIGVDIFNAVIVDIEKPYWIDIRMDAPVMIFAIGVTMAASLLAGTVPAFKASGPNVQDVLKDESKGSSGFRLSKFSTTLVVGEIALSGALLVAAGMMTKSVVNLKTLDMGFETSNLFTARVALFESNYPDDASQKQFHEALARNLAGLPGAQSVALTSNLPATGAGQYWFGVDGVSYTSDQDYPFAFRATITPGLFSTIGVTMREGRDFTAQDRDGSLPVVIVNQSFASKYFPQQPALGQRIRFGRSNSERPWMTVVGVVPDMHVGGGVGGLGSSRTRQEQFFTPLDQTLSRFMYMVVKTRGEPLAVASQVREAVAAIDADLPIFEVDSMDGAIETATWAFGLFGSLFTIFGAIALFMAAVGLYGVMAFSVNRRTQELGIRMALGARGGQIMRMVVTKGMIQLAIGTAVGLGLGAVMARPLQVALFDVNPNDPTVYATIVAAFALAGLAACVIPARRATRVQLVDALRPE